MSSELKRIVLLVAVVLLAVATWLNDAAAADAVFVFSAFSIGGVWAKSCMGLHPEA